MFNLLLSQISNEISILCDIEGITASISFIDVQRKENKENKNHRFQHFQKGVFLFSLSQHIEVIFRETVNNLILTFFF